METIAQAIAKAAQTQPKEGGQQMLQRCSAALAKYGDAAQMVKHHTIDILPVLADPQRRDAMILYPAPAMALMAQAYGREKVELVVEGHVMQLADAMGVQYERKQVKMCASDIVSGWYYLTIYEIAAALKMAREGRFRDNNGRNMATMYGAFSSAAVIDCIAFFVKNYRAPLIDQQEQQQRADAKERAAQTGITWGEYKERCKAEGKEIDPEIDALLSNFSR